VVVVGTTERKKSRATRRCHKQSPRKKMNGDTPLDYSGRTALRWEQCDGMPENRNGGIGSEVDFLGNELLRRLHDKS
jgi:hypothetical protein